MKKINLVVSLALCLLVMPLRAMENDEPSLWDLVKKNPVISSVVVLSAATVGYGLSLFKERRVHKKLSVHHAKPFYAKADDKKITGVDETKLPGLAFFGKLAEIKKLLADGVPIDQRDNEGCTALHRAAQKGYLNIIELLIKRGAFDSDQVDNNGLTALGHAAGNGNIFSAIVLIDAIKNQKGSVDSPLNIKNRKTPLYCALKHNYFAMAAHLLNNGARADIPDENGITPLHLAVKKCADTDTNFISLCIQKCVTVKIEDNMGNTPLSIAETLNKPLIADLLLKDAT